LLDFSDVLNTRVKGKAIIKKVGLDISERTYLGNIKDKNGHIKFYVVKEFLRVKAAVVYHGHSSILFFTKDHVLNRRSVLSLPAELPFKLENNMLFFKYRSGSQPKTFKVLLEPLPRMICVEPRSCYDVSIP